jgi:hypothetical protein
MSIRCLVNEIPKITCKGIDATLMNKTQENTFSVSKIHKKTCCDTR